LKISGKTVLITGGAKRIGRALVEAFAAAGARVVIHCNTSEEEAQRLIASLPGSGHQVINADFAKKDSVEQIFSKCGRIDILVNCASTFERCSVLEENRTCFEHQFQVNFIAPFEMMKAFAAQTGKFHGVIINFTDQRTVSCSDGTGSYLLSKKALTEATLTAAKQFAPEIRVNAIAPGPVLPPVELKGRGMTHILKEVPLDKPVDIDDLVNAVFFLVSNESITGQILFVDCGQHLI